MDSVELIYICEIDRLSSQGRYYCMVVDFLYTAAKICMDSRFLLFAQPFFVGHLCQHVMTYACVLYNYV